jgi:hypothetical protein
MKIFLPLTLLIAGAGFTQASIIESISLDLGPLHAGSILSGTFTLSNRPMVGDTAAALLSFSDPSNYTPTSLTSTITIESGTPSGFAIVFSPLMFTNLSGNVTPINTRDVFLTPFGFAMCASFPCTATGGFQDRSPAVFTSKYTISPAAVPEPGNGLLVVISLTAIAFGRRRVRAARANRFGLS